MYLVLYENRPLCKILSLLPSFTLALEASFWWFYYITLFWKACMNNLWKRTPFKIEHLHNFYKKQNRQNGNNAKRNTTSLYWQKHIRNDKLSWQNFITHFLFKLANGSWTWNIEGKLYIMYSIFCLLLLKTQLSANWAIN